jgi:aryl-alcohol dehydrogenase-like predicted oxidoreductase
MEQRRLGLTDLNVSRVGFGGWAIGGHGWGKVDDDQSLRAIRRASELGINFFDTADVYGFGHSEEVLSRALGEDRKKVIIATKFGIRWDEKGKTFRDASAKWVVKALEGSLRRLKLDCISLYQIHWPDPETSLEETLEALRKCQEAGKIKYIGCSNFSVELITRAHRVCRLHSLQAAYNLVDWGNEGELISCWRRFGIGVVCYNPLAQGLLTGKFGPEARFGSDDVRSRSKYFKAGEFERNLRTVAELREVAKRYGKTPAQVALRWALDHPCVTSVIPGIKNPQQIEENAGAMGWELAREDRERLALATDARAERYVGGTPEVRAGSFFAPGGGQRRDSKGR